MSTLDAGLEIARTSPAGFSVDIATDWNGADWTGGKGTPFQRREWLDAFYAAAKIENSISPLIVTIRDARGHLALRLPLIIRRRDGLTAIEMADTGMTDFNAPLMGPAAPKTEREARLALRALKRALPKADILSLKKMPLQVQGRANPLALLTGTRPSVVNGNIIELTDNWEDYHRSRHRNFRMELGRCWRLFEKNPGAEFRVVRDPQEALRVLEIMESQQRERMLGLGAQYTLDEPMVADFYRRFVAENVETGYALLTTLMVGDELVSASMGVYDKETFIAIRLSNAGKKWSHISPGRILLEKTMQYIHADGCRHIDLSIGNYAYKRRFGVTRCPMVDYSLALSWRGIAEMLGSRLAGTTRQYPELHARIRKALGKSPSREEH